MNKLIFIGLGLNDGRDISIKGFDELNRADEIFAEFYTAIMAQDTIEYLESKLNKTIQVLTRKQIEDGSMIIESAKNKNIAFLCQGDSLTATTHIELLLMAKQEDIEIEIIHGTSIVSAVPGLLGLQFYKFGRTTTLAFPEGDYFPESPYDVIVENLKRNLHTMVLLDIQVEKNKIMTANDAIELLLDINTKRKDDVFKPSTLICVVCRAGANDSKVFANKASKLIQTDFGPPLHTIVVPGKLHFKEAEALIKLAGAPKEILDSLNILDSLII